jgi:hypothetical protein
MTDDALNALNAIIAKWPGLPCWSVQVSGVGSLANLHFGEKIEREHVMSLHTFQVDVDERLYQGETVLYLEECPWRLDSPEDVLCSWMDDSTPEGRLTQGLMQLKGRTVTAVKMTQPALDLTVEFDGGLALRIFPDQVDPDEGDNYSITAGKQTFVVAARSTLYIE